MFGVKGRRGKRMKHIENCVLFKHQKHTFHALCMPDMFLFMRFSRTAFTHHLEPFVGQFSRTYLFTHIFHALYGSPQQQCHKEPDHLESGVWIWDLGSGVASGIWGLESGITSGI